MIDPELVPNITDLMKNLSPGQKMIMSQVVQSREYRIIQFNNRLCVLSKSGEFFELIKFISTKKS